MIQRPLYADACEPQRYIVVGHDEESNMSVAGKLGEHASVILVSSDSITERFVWDIMPAAEPEREHVVVTLPLQDKDVAYRLALMLVRRYGEAGFPESLAVALCDLSTDDQCPFHHLVFNAGAKSLGCITL
jgi:hypothetical protein